ncbi:hypothetical protein OWM07_03260 [Deferribacter thermophilus]|uniref:hypothetical protein n=1 Tax=Deferribacter thermophilus TaxID=53573 RepID=UPI003C20556B
MENINLQEIKEAKQSILNILKEFSADYDEADPVLILLAIQQTQINTLTERNKNLQEIINSFNIKLNEETKDLNKKIDEHIQQAVQHLNIASTEIYRTQQALKDKVNNLDETTNLLKNKLNTSTVMQYKNEVKRIVNYTNLLLYANIIFIIINFIINFL